MLFFNDPLPCDEAKLQAVRLALEMRQPFDEMDERWRKLDYALGFSIGIATSSHRGSQRTPAGRVIPPPRSGQTDTAHQRRSRTRSSHRGPASI
jgi:hypothetical protein